MSGRDRGRPEGGEQGHGLARAGRTAQYLGVQVLLRVCRCGGVHVFRCGGVEVWRCACVHVCSCACVQLFRCLGV